MKATKKAVSLQFSPSRIFISYRRNDSAGHAGRLLDYLTRHYGKRNVFRDVERIPGGQDFVEALDTALSQCNVVLAVIGPGWLCESNDNRERLFSRDDYVRWEVSSALQMQGVKVIPVLVGGAKMPRRDQLPKDLWPLVTKNVKEIRDTRFSDDTRDLVRAIGSRYKRCFGLSLRVWVVFTATLAITWASAFLLIRPSTPPKMSGSFRVAVAEFATGGDKQYTDEGARIGNLIYQSIKKINYPYDGYEAWGPQMVGLVKNSPEAMQTAQEIESDVLVYGAINLIDEIVIIQPSFHISDRNFADAEEVLGVHSLGKDIVVDRTGFSGRKKIGDELRNRINVLSDIMTGLSYYTARDFDQSFIYFQSLEKQYREESDGLLKVIYLFQANSAGKAGNLSAAENNYYKALKIDPKYARAYIGLSAVYYVRAIRSEKSKGSSEVAVSYIKKCLDFANKASRTVEHADDPDLHARVDFAFAQASLFLALKGLVKIETARVRFQAVVDTFEQRNHSYLQALAAESHARLGLIALRKGANDTAIAEYEKAADLSLQQKNIKRHKIFLEKSQAIRDSW